MCIRDRDISYPIEKIHAQTFGIKISTGKNRQFEICLLYTSFSKKIITKNKTIETVSVFPISRKIKAKNIGNAHSVITVSYTHLTMTVYIGE